MVSNRPYNKSTDIWCLGVLAYEFLVGEPPFVAPTEEVTHAKIRNVDFKIPNLLSEEARSFVQATIKETGRPTWD